MTTPNSFQIDSIKGLIIAKYENVNPRLQRSTIEIPANMVGELLLDTFSDK